MTRLHTLLPVRPLLAIATAAAALLAACTMQSGGGARSTPSMAAPEAPAAAVPESAIVVRDMTGLQDVFSFGNAMGAILRSARVDDTPANRTALVQTMIGTFQSGVRAN